MPRTTNANVAYLREHGPAPVDDLPNDSISLSDRIAGVWKFKVNGRTRGHASADAAGGRVSLVAYLPEEHPREAVIAAFLEANPRLVEHKSRAGLRRLLRRQGRPWHDAIDAVYPSTPDGTGRFEREADA